MAKLKLLSLVVLFFCVHASAKSLQLEFYAQAVLPSSASLDGVKVGGLSGIFWTGSRLIAVSDDRGKIGKPRYYDLDLKITEKKVEFKAVKSYPVTIPEKAWVFDDEALIALANGDLWISTEGDNNKKPRAMPHIFRLGSDGKFKDELPIPDKFLPESLGEQKRGIENNRGFEGVTISQDSQHMYAVNETPLVTESVAPECATSWVRIIDFTKDLTDDKYKATAEYAYPIEKLASSEASSEVFRGVSEMLWWEPNKVLVLERGAKLTTKSVGYTYTGSIYVYDFGSLKDVSKVGQLCVPAATPGKKELLVDLAAALKSEKIENFEGLSWGPALPDGRKSLLVISDNNFSSREHTQLLVFAVKEVP